MQMCGMLRNMSGSMTWPEFFDKVSQPCPVLFAVHMLLNKLTCCQYSESFTLFNYSTRFQVASGQAKHSMAEVAGLALAVPAVVGTALKFADYLYKYYRDIDAADGDIVAFSFDIRSFATTTKYSFSSLDRICRRLRDARSPVFEHLQNEGILDDLASKCRRTKRQINSAWDCTDSAQSWLSFWARWKWVNRKSDVLALRTHMESLKTSMTLIVSIITLESSHKPLPDNASQSEIEDQKAMM